MTSYQKMCEKARELGHELTPELQGELRMLATVTDEEISVKLADSMVDHVARKFAVTPGVSRMRLEQLGYITGPGSRTEKKENDG